MVMMMTNCEKPWIAACGAFAAGEALASLLPSGAEAWPLPLAVAVVVALFGYGFRIRGWRLAAALMLGVCAFWLSSVSVERQLRETPWMRGARRHMSAPRRADPIRRELSRRIGIGLPADSTAAALNRAMLLGERSRISPKVKRLFVDSGTVHVFAVSGLHVMVVARLLAFLAAIMMVPYRFQGAVAMPAVWAYVLLVGAPPSAVRAALMATFYYGAPLFLRRPNGVMAWVLAFLSVHAVNPRQIADTGSQLSFSVMLALVMTSRLLSGSGRGVILKGFFLTCAAWAAGAPIVAMSFGRLAPGGLAANLIVVAAAGYSVVAGAVGLAASFFSERLASHFNNLAALMTDAMVFAADAVSRLPFCSFETSWCGATECIEWYAAFALVLVLASMVQSRRQTL